MAKKKAKTIKNKWNEQWAIIEEEGYETKNKDYYYSNYGRLKSLDKVSGDENQLRGTTTIQGYKQIYVNYKTKQKGYYVHRLVGMTFLPKDHEDQKFLMHIDGDYKNNHVMNLRWATEEERTAIRREKGVYDPENRKRSPVYKMNPTKVRLLKKKLKEGKIKKKILAKNFDITVEQLRKIEKGINWGWVKLEDEDQGEVK